MVAQEDNLKSVLMSIKPKYCELIVSGKKTIEVRKSKPKLQTPFKCYVYCTKSGFLIYGDEKQYVTDYSNLLNKDASKAFEKTTNLHKWNGKIIGEFVCDCIIPISITYSDPNNRIAQKEFPYTCLTDKEIMDYLGNGNQGYGWHISNLVIYEEPKELNKFMVVDKNKLKECPYRERIYQNPDFCNGNYLLGGYLCKKINLVDFDDFHFCEGGCSNVFKPMSRPPQSWCYVEV